MTIKYESDFGKLICGDCIEVLPELVKEQCKIDMVLTDMPYGTTKCAWDSVIPIEPVWDALSSLVRMDGAIVFTATQPFTSFLVSSKPEYFAYDWCWKKRHTGQLDVKRRPLRNKEDILVFCLGGKAPRYFPQKTLGKPYSAFRKGYKGSSCYGKQKDHDTVNITGERYPMQIVEFIEIFKRIHPTQKPMSLMEYLIKTYTQQGDVVLDFTAGVSTTAIAAMNTGRRFICIEKDESYCEQALQMIVGLEIEMSI